jgi:uncharacterized protein involved in outer membrane biogenesis
MSFTAHTEAARMNKILKVVAIVVGALAVIVIAVLFAVGYLFNPNDYKGQMSAPPR